MWNVAHGVGDRDDSPHAVHERAVDVAERSEEIAVVVVTRRDERNAEQRAQRATRRRRRGPCACAARSGRSRRTARATSRASRGDASSPHGTRGQRDAALVEGAVEPVCIVARVEREEARVDAPLAQRAGGARAGAAPRRRCRAPSSDGGLSPRRGSSRYRRSTSSTMRSVENRSRIRCGARLPESRAAARRRRAAARAASASAATSPTGARKPVSPSSTTVARAAGIRRDDGHACRQRLDRHYRRAFVRRRQEEARRTRRTSAPRSST